MEHNITLQRGSVMQCYIGDVSFQREKPIISGLLTEMSLTDQY
jgi:hypothetical protein